MNVNNAKKILVFDTETTGLIQNDHRNVEVFPYIIQLAYIGYNISNGKIEISCNDIIKLPKNVTISQGSIDIHKITRAISEKDGIDIKESLLKFRDAIDWSDCVIAHNISFDKKMVLKESQRNKLLSSLNFNKDTNGNYIPEYCTMKKGINICKIKKWNPKKKQFYIKQPKLIELYNTLFKKTPTGLHNAFIDIKVCLACFLKMEKDINIYDLMDIDNYNTITSI